VGAIDPVFFYDITQKTSSWSLFIQWGNRISGFLALIFSEKEIEKLVVELRGYFNCWKITDFPADFRDYCTQISADFLIIT